MSTEAEPTPAPPELVTRPADGVPPVVDTPDALARTVAALSAGTGPVGIDTERAQGFRYSGKAYLVQLRRAEAGTHLVDPVAFEEDDPRADLTPLARAIREAEWVVHAASQDLPCLAEVGLLPHRLFDTELAGRLLGLPRVSLGALVEHALGKALRKEHSAADWSRRPLPEDWLTYAALDVELLGALRDWAADELRAAGKDEWAAQEFAYLAAHAADPPTRRTDPWRRTSGIHDLRTQRGLAVVRALWVTRDEISEGIDRAPGRVLGDRAITELAGKVEAATATPSPRDLVRQVRGFSWRLAVRFEAEWVAAVERALALSKSELPPQRAPAEGPPPPRAWGNRHPEAAARWERIRPATLTLAEELALPVENLIAPDLVRRIAWEPPAEVTDTTVHAFLAALGARPWQRGLVVPVITPLLV